MSEKYSEYAISDMYRFLNGKYSIAKKCFEACTKEGDDIEVIKRYEDTMKICEKMIEVLGSLNK